MDDPLFFPNYHSMDQQNTGEEINLLAYDKSDYDRLQFLRGRVDGLLLGEEKPKLQSEQPRKKVGSVRLWPSCPSYSRSAI